MIARSTPGVYFEWQDRQAPPTLARTDVAGFVGIAERGPLHTPLVVENWSDFRQKFGGHIAAGYLAYAVEGFFLNGGRRCYIVRVADPNLARSAELDLVSGVGTTLRLTASSPGVWGQRLSATVLPLVDGHFNLTLRLDDESPEIWRDLSLDSKDERYAAKLLNGKRLEQVGLALEERSTGDLLDDKPIRQVGSSLVRAREVTPDPRDDIEQLPVNSGMANALFKGGADGLRTLTPAHLSGRGAPGEAVWGLAALGSIQEVAIVAIPDLMPAPKVTVRHLQPRLNCDDLSEPAPQPEPADPDHPPVFEEAEVRELQRELIGHCERHKDRIALLDTRLEDRNPQTVVAWRQEFDSSYAALYYPWLRVPDPLRLEGLLRTIPPSGYISGLYARVENASGPHQPPANERLENVRDLTVAVEDVVHGYLYDHRVNLIRAYPARGLRPMGARTLSSEPQLRYINVRRLLLALERTLQINTQWLVFETNNPQLQAEVARVLRGLMDGLWLRGMLDGGTPDEAYSVVCDATTNPPAESDAGRLLAVLTLRPPYPAEFVVVRVGRTDQGIQFLAGSEVQHGPNR